MAEIMIALPQALLDYAEGQVGTGTHADIGDFVRDLIRRDKAARDELWAALDQGEASGISDRSFDEIIADARERARSRAA